MRVDKFADDQEAALADQVLDNPIHFVRAVTDLSEESTVLAKEDIFASCNIKLVSRGTRLSGEFYERLVAHKRLKPIEKSIAVESAPNLEELVSLAHAEAQQIPSLKPLLGPAQVERISSLLAGIRIPEEISTQLAVMRSERPRLWRHSLLAGVIAMVLGIRAELPKEELHALAIGSLLHDIGELYIDPKMLASAHRLNADERRYLYAHPIIGFLLLRVFPELPKGAAEAILQSHELLDGTGYPSRLSGNEISRVARFVTAAGVTASLIEKEGATRRIGIKLRMNMKKFDPQAIAIICGMLDPTPHEAMSAMNRQDMIIRLGMLGSLFKTWDSLRDQCASSNTPCMEQVVEQVDSLRMMVLEPGYDLYALERILEIADDQDAEVITELSVLLEEITWHFGTLLRTIENQQLKSTTPIVSGMREKLEEWVSQVTEFISQGSLLGQTHA